MKDIIKIMVGIIIFAFAIISLFMIIENTAKNECDNGNSYYCVEK